MNTSPSTFSPVLAARRRLRIAALAASFLLTCAAWTGIVVLLAIGADYLWSFSPQVLDVLCPDRTYTGIAVGVLVVICTLLARLISDPGRTADAIDTNAGDGRRSARLALDLAQHPPAGETGRALASLAVERAASTLATTALTAALPVRRLKRSLCISLPLLAVTAGTLLATWPVSRQILQRFRHPHADLPPYSPHTFKVLPDKPSVLYGGTLDLRVEIGGPDPRGEVRLLTRSGTGTRAELPCFREDVRRFAQKLNAVREPVEVAFALGRARSPWIPVDIVYDPRITRATLRAQPPAYSGKPARESTAGDGPLRELAGTLVELQVFSNRPLAGGELTLTPSQGDVRRVTGQPAGPDRVSFAWTLETDATAEVRVTDPRGLVCQEPLTFRQAVVPDEPPRVSLREPRRFALATPAAKLKIDVSAEDDLGLARVDWVRALTGYRDRSLPLGPVPVSTRLEESREIDLGPLGVEPGQTLEFYLEATDTNPDGSGRVLSDLARVKIISEADYAKMLRERMTLRDFTGRYRAASGAVKSVREGIAGLRKTVQAAKAGAPEVTTGLEALRTRTGAAADLMKTLFEDFPVYELDEQSQALIGEVALLLAATRDDVKKLKAEDGGLDARLAALEDRLREPERQLAKKEEEAEEVARVARLLQLARAFPALIGEQQWVVRRMERYPDPAALRDAATFRSLARAQREVESRLTSFVTELRERAEDVKTIPGAEKFGKDAYAFADKIDAAQIPPVMNTAAVAGDNHDGRVLLDAARDALERLLKLLEEPDNEFASACRGQQPGEGQGQRNGRTLGQLGEGMGLAQGAGQGDSLDGYALGANTPLNTPVYGPERTRFDSEAPTGTRTAQNPSRNGRAERVLSEPGAETGGNESATAGTAGGVRLERTPEKYRDAVRRYFAEEPAPEPVP